jgi:two-component system alkaline phosphatase synthesis response regulator PhoP
MFNHLSVLIVQGTNSQFSELADELSRLKLKVSVVESSSEAIDFLKNSTPNLLLLDLLIDRRDAIDVLNESGLLKRSDHCTKVVFSDRNEKYVEITSLNAGADDFLTKPVNKRVFSARLNAWLRHHLITSGKRLGQWNNGDIVLDEDKFAAFVSDKEVALQRKEFEIMQLLLSKPRKVFSREEIKENVWVEVQNVRNRTIDVHIRNLRSKLGSRYIKTYKGIGYSYES